MEDGDNSAPCISVNGNTIRETLISLVKECPAIWDSNRPDYSKKSIVQNDWDTILTRFREMYPPAALRMFKASSVDQLKSIWQSLRGSYRVSKKKASSGSGSSRDDTVTNASVTFPFYSQMRFLDSIAVPAQHFVRTPGDENFGEGNKTSEATSRISDDFPDTLSDLESLPDVDVKVELKAASPEPTKRPNAWSSSRQHKKRRRKFVEEETPKQKVPYHLASEDNDRDIALGKYISTTLMTFPDDKKQRAHIHLLNALNDFILNDQN